ncbi:hypothetical protein [Alkalinema sp. FACHB-956]|uniref:hypothetical protein n=1 Tax=Alkalinema sp. FACHB-956 TaxID=2692768 RepID=UPI001688750E|nr:hypothetical protein [Alkalinema sp. FACHB-956]MBD2328068.1 hypothetical protein [Alkalinema sp. FACHB-956]
MVNPLESELSLDLLDLPLHDPWEAGFGFPPLPKGMAPRRLTDAELDWLERAALTEYICPDDDGLEAIVYAAPPESEKVKKAWDWYLRPDHFWDQPPRLLKAVMADYPIDGFQLTAKQQPPNLVPDFAYDLPIEDYSKLMRSLNREFYRLGWSLPQYKWFVMEQFRKTTAQLSPEEFSTVVEMLQAIPAIDDDD